MFPNSVLPLPAPLHVESMPLPDSSSDVASSSNTTQPSSLRNDTETHDTLDNEAHIARSKRPTRAPSYLSDYHCSLIPFTTINSPPCHDPQPIFPTHTPISYVLSYDRLAPHFQTYTLAYTLEREPTNFKEAMASKVWDNAVNVELGALEENRTWDIVSLLVGKNVVGCRWIFTIKYNADGTIKRYKARLVAQGFTQQEGVDYMDTFSPFTKLTNVKLLFGLAAAKGWSLTQMDVSNAFLHGDLDEEIYMSLPQDYMPSDGTSLPPNHVCRLRKSLYGLKQASRQWYKRFSSVLLRSNFFQSPADNTLFVKKVNDSFVAVLVYVDDILIASNDDLVVCQLKELLSSEFKIKDLVPARFFLGLEIARSSTCIFVC